MNQAASLLPERPPRVGELVEVRSRRWLVEGVEDAAPPTSPRVSLACADDDAQGQTLEVYWDFEIDRRILEQEAWSSIGARPDIRRAPGYRWRVDARGVLSSRNAEAKRSECSWLRISVPDSAFPCFRISGTVRHLPTPLEDADMSQTLVVSSRGQITLPAATRKRLGIKGGDHVILEDRGGEIVLKPGMVLEVQHYSDEQIASWDADDELEDRERTRILDAVARRK